MDAQSGSEQSALFAARQDGAAADAGLPRHAELEEARAMTAANPSRRVGYELCRNRSVLRNPQALDRIADVYARHGVLKEALPWMTEAYKAESSGQNEALMAAMRGDYGPSLRLFRQDGIPAERIEPLSEGPGKGQLRVVMQDGSAQTFDPSARLLRNIDPGKFMELQGKERDRQRNQDAIQGMLGVRPTPQPAAGQPGSGGQASSPAPTGRPAGILSEYLDHADPQVRRMAQNARQAISVMADPKEAATHARAVEQQITAHLDRVESRDLRRELTARKSNDPKATTMMQNIEFLRQRGIAGTDEEAFRMLRTSMEKPRREAVLDLAQTLFRANSWRYGGDLNQAAAEAESFFDRMMGADQKSASGGSTGAQPPRNASSSIPQGYRQVGREKGTGRPVYEGPDGQRYVEQVR
jgi:hypothetical protein